MSFCGKCGTNLKSDDYDFCPQCGNRIVKEHSLGTYGSDYSPSVAAKGSPLKIIIIAGAIALAIILLIIIKNKMSCETINLNQYATIVFDGYFNPDEPRVKIDTDGLEKEFIGKLRINESTEKEESNFYVLATSPYGARYCADYLIYTIGVYGGVDFEKGSSDNEYVIKWTHLNKNPAIKEDIKYRFNVELEYSDFTYVVPESK